MRKPRWLLHALLILVAVLLLYPFETTVVPEWKVRIVDEAGTPVKAIRVKQFWQNYSVELSGNQQELMTDDSGFVSFPRRTVRANLLHRIFVSAINIVTQGFHASFGVSAHLVPVSYDKYLAGAIYSPSKPLPGEIVLKSRDSAPQRNDEVPAAGKRELNPE